jgi:hypothetical protein
LSSALPEPLAVTLRVVRALDRFGIRYLIGGSLASSLHGVPRNTNDADIVAELPAARIPELAADLKADFYADEDMMVDAVRRGASFNLIHLETMFKVDIFVLRREPLLLEEMSRRQEHVLAVDSPERAWFASPEDTVLQKLDWYKKGQQISERQWGDVLGVLKVREGELELDYLRKWAPTLGVSELLEKALIDAGTDERR